MTPTMPPYPGPPPAMMVAPVPRERKTAFLMWGSIIRIIGAVLAGLALIALGFLIMNPLGFIGSPTNPFGFFNSLGLVIVLAGLGSILTGIGWTVQTWAVGQILVIDRG